MATIIVNELDIASLEANLVYDTGTLAWIRMQQPILNAGSVVVSGTMTANQGTAHASAKWLASSDITTGQGKTLLFSSISQGGAGTTQLVAADATKKIKVVSYIVVLSAAGTLKFLDGVGDKTGTMSIVASGGISAPGQSSSHWFETAANSALSITTTGGAAMGHLSYFLEA